MGYNSIVLDFTPKDLNYLGYSSRFYCEDIETFYEHFYKEVRRFIGRVNYKDFIANIGVYSDGRCLTALDITEFVEKHLHLDKLNQILTRISEKMYLRLFVLDVRQNDMEFFRFYHTHGRSEEVSGSIVYPEASFLPSKKLIETLSPKSKMYYKIVLGSNNVNLTQWPGEELVDFYRYLHNEFQQENGLILKPFAYTQVEISSDFKKFAEDIGVRIFNVYSEISSMIGFSDISAENLDTIFIEASKQFPGRLLILETMTDFTNEFGRLYYKDGQKQVAETVITYSEPEI